MIVGMSEFLAPISDEVSMGNPFQELAEALLHLEDHHGMERNRCPIVHRFTPGMYIREMTLPADTFVISMKHRFEHPFVISKGKIRVVEDGKDPVVLEAPYTGITPPGTQRVAYAMEDSIWTTFHATEETDPEAIGNAILEPQENPRLNQWRDDLPQYQKNLES